MVQAKRCEFRETWTARFRKLLRDPMPFSALATGLALMLFTLTGGFARAQELDDTRRDQRGERHALPWTNLSHSAQHIGGVKPRHRPLLRLSTVKLSPGEATEFLVPPGEMIRVEAIDGTRVDDGKTLLWVSNGSGLYRRLTSGRTADGNALLAMPNDTGYSIARVSRPSSAAWDAEYTIHTTDRSRLRTLDYYACRMPLCPTKTVSDDRGGRPREYSDMAAGEPVRLKLPGASRLRVEARLRYGLQPQQRQSFWIRVYVGGNLYRILSFDTALNPRKRQFIGGKEVLLGRQEFAYLDLDCGDKEVKLEASHDCLLRVDGVGLNLCRPNFNRSFRYPSWQNLRKAISNWDALSFDPAAVLGSIDDESYELTQITGDPLWDPYLNSQRMQAIARDNQIPHGGLRAYMWMLACASLHPNDPSHRDEIPVEMLTRRFRQHYTTFVDCDVDRIPAGAVLRHAAFLRREIRSPDRRGDQRIFAAQHLDSALSSLGQSRLIELSDDRTAMVFRPPADVGTSIVRLIVDQTHLAADARLMIQYDDRSPVELRVSSKSCLDLSQFVPTAAEAAMTAMSATYGKFDQSTVGGPFAQFRDPVPVVRAATTEMIKPADVREIRVWVSSCDAERIAIGLQCLKGRETELSETSYRSLSVLADDATADAASREFAASELANDAWSLEQTLRRYHQQILDSVSRNPIVDPPSDVWPEERTRNHWKQIESRLAAQQWAAAIELLSELIRNSSGDTRRRAILSRIDALSSAGESYLAAQEQRGWMIFSQDEALRKACFDRVLKTAEEEEDDYEQLRHLAFAVIQWHDESLEIRLAQQLAKGGNFRGALILLSTLQSTPKTESLLLQCSLQEQWWTTFDSTLDRVKDPAKKNLWLGIKQWRLGFRKHAENTLRAGEQDGLRWLAWGLDGESIFEQLTSDDPTLRWSAISRWEDWQLRNPSRPLWKSLRSGIRGASGMTGTISLTHRKRMSYALARPEQPVEIDAIGPARIRVLVRPIHDAGSQTAINDWLHVVHNGSASLVPINRNRPSKDVRIDDESKQPGKLVTTVLELPAGRNQFRVHCEQSNALVRVEVERPEISLPMLPPINKATMSAVIAGDFGRMRQPRADNLKWPEGDDCVRIFRRDHQCVTLSCRYVVPTCRCTAADTADHHFDQLTLGRIDDLLDRALPISDPPIIADRDEMMDEAIAMVHQVESSHQYEGLDQPVDRLHGIVLLDLLKKERETERSGPDVALEALDDRLRQGTGWETLRDFDQRAGVHQKEVNGWSPESPGLRIRKSLMPKSEAQHAVYGDSRLVLDVDDESMTAFEVDLRQPSVGFLPLDPSIGVIESRWQSQSVLNTVRNQTETIRLTLPGGLNSIEISQGNLTPNVYALVDLFEIVDDDRRPIDHARLRKTVPKRSYHVATADQPLTLSRRGPMVLRIDRVVDGVTTSETIASLEDRTLHFQPAEGDPPELYRVFELTVRDSELDAPDAIQYREDIRPRSRSDHWTGDIVQAAYDQIDHPESLSSMDTLGLRSGDLTPLTLHFDDWASPRGRADGTSGVAVRFRSRFVDEEFPQPPVSDEFWEVRYERLRENLWKDHHTQTDFLVRARDSGASTLGLEHRLTREFSPACRCESGACRCANRWSGTRVDFRGYLLGQIDLPRLPGATIPTTLGTTGFRLGLSMGRFWNEDWSERLTLSLFGRAVQDSARGFVPGVIDQDVFTRYKSDHPYGIRLSHRTLFEHHLDSRFWLRPLLVSNSDQIIPDYLSIQTGTDQLIGPFQIQLAYRATQFFADNDRANARFQNVVAADILLSHWNNANHRSEWSFTLRSDVTNNKTTLGTRFVHYWNDGRGFRDFRPGSLTFRPVREERAAWRSLFDP